MRGPRGLPWFFLYPSPETSPGLNPLKIQFPIRKLSETPASVSVFTEEFLQDIGATGLAEVLEYGVNSNADLTSTGDGGLLNEVRINNRGLTASKTIDFLETTLPTDVYNTGRFDVSSGPNSVLFGFGSAAGIVNAQTRLVDLRRTSVKLSSIAGSWNAYRAEADTRSLNAYLGDFMSDLASNGYELEVKASPTKNWTITISYSYTKLQRSNLGQDWYPWFAAQKDYYAKFPGSLVTSAAIPISTEVTQIEAVSKISLP